jgi:branched-chain amino acid transport system ATP-binding protein
MAELLRIEGLRAGYGEAVVLDGLSLAVAEGRTLALLGRNGMGKTTTLGAVIGVVRRFAGTIGFAGKDISFLRADQRANAGIGWVPQERNIFRSLTVAENLSCIARPGRWDVAAVFSLFPRLAERRGNLGHQLSGGEQQMLAFGRALVLNPRLLLLDEPTEGLAPIIVEELLAAITRVTREEGLAAVIVEQHAHKLLGITDDAVILERGAVAYAGGSAALLAEPAILERLLGVA